MSDQSKTPWKDGYYYCSTITAWLKKVDGSSCDVYSILKLDYPDIDPIGDVGTWTFGDFGPAHEDVQKASGGITNYNIEMNVFNNMDHNFGIVSEDGKTIYSWGMMNELAILKWQTDEDLKRLSDEREPFETPSCSYKIQPENQGKLVWLSGPPGAGKSTTAQLMGKDAGYVYYEADCTACFLNPFVPTDVDNPTIAAFKQKALKGIPKDVADQAKVAEDEFKKLMVPDGEADWEKLKPFYTNMAKDVAAQKKRIGGNFSIAQAVTSQEMRDHIRLTIPDCIFITLTMTQESQIKRIKARHGEDLSEGLLDMMSGIHKLYELPGENEPNTFNIDITESMNRKDVLNKVLEVLDDQPKTPWKNGYYFSKNLTSFLKKVDGQSCDMYSILKLDYPDMDPIATKGTWNFGDFGPAHKEVQNATGGVKNYNIEMNVWNGMDHCFGVISEDGETIYSWGMINAVDVLQWQSDQDWKTLFEDREPYDSPNCPYKIQPENQGKVVWLSGPPGAGKSTTAQLMGRDAGYVYYEADCALNFLNPFVPTDVDNPTLAAFRQKPLKGVPRDVAEDVKEAEVEFGKLMQPGANVDWDKMKPGYTTLAKDINAQKKRIGGNFSIAEAVPSRAFRDHIRQTIPDCIFITLTMAKEAQIKRLKARHGDDMSEGMLEVLSNIHELYELPGVNEPNTFNVDINDDMKPQDVMKKVLDILKNNFD